MPLSDPWRRHPKPKTTESRNGVQRARLDRAAAIRAPKDPLNRSRLPWPHRRVQVDHDGRFAFPEAVGRVRGGDDPRWYVAAEQRGWWRGDPVRIAGSGATERLVLPPR